MSLSRLNNYVRGTRKMDDDAVIACCELLGWNARKYVAAHRAESASTKREMTFWRKIAGSAIAVLIACLSIPSQASYITAGGSIPPTGGPEVCIMRS